MADSKITDLPASGGLALADLFVVVDDPSGSPETQGATGTQVLALIVANVDAGDITFTPAGNLAATDVQAALEELDSEKATAAQGALADSAQQPPSEGPFVNGDKTKLDGIESSADVTDTANVTAAGALMDSEVTNLSQVKAFSSADYATAAQGTLADSATQPGDLGTAAAEDVGYFATAAQGTLADSATQPGDLGALALLATVGSSEIDDEAVTFAKIQDVAANSILGRAAGSGGVLSEIALSASQLFGRGSTGDIAAITLGSNLSMSGTTLNASGGSGGGDVSGPVSSTDGYIPLWSGTGGDTLVDGIATSTFASAAQGALADSALQAAAIGVSVQAYDAQLDEWSGIDPSANGASLVSAANYGAMRALLDLEAGTDFYSISAADAAFQPLDSDLTAIAALAKTDSNFIVGNGSAWVVESGSTARTSMGAAALGANTFTGTQSFADNLLSRPYFQDYAELLATASVSGSVTVSYANGNVHALTMTGNITTLTLSNWPATGRHGKLTLYLIHSGGARTVSWPAAVKWGAAGAPTLSGSGDTDVITLVTRDGGTTVYGFANGLDFS